MAKIKKVNSLEDLKMNGIFGAKINGEEKVVPVFFEGNSYEWYSFIKRQNEGEDILRAEVSRHFLIKCNGIVEIKESNSIQTTYTPYDKGYYYRKSLLVNNNLWRKEK